MHQIRRWPMRLLLLCGFTAAAVTSNEATTKLLQDLDAIVQEEEARNLVMPLTENLKALDSKVIEKVILKQWWTLAQEIVAKSHVQKVDLSFGVRKAVRSLKDEADELLRTLNPKYGTAQQVSPAFQWAQNDTSVFLTIKYTVRWNAPGALEVTDPSVNMTGNIFNFTGLGKHSNNKYKYFLSLDLFDNIDAEVSVWSAASVGKLSVTLRKKWARKWPRLLNDKKLKIGNMHVWMDMQEKLSSTLSGFSTVSQSPVTCAKIDKLYCVVADSCKKPDACNTCGSKDQADFEDGICAGKPVEKASLSFSDGDMDEHQLGGDIIITKAKSEFDVDTYTVYWGKDDRSRLEDASGNPLPAIGQAKSNMVEPKIHMSYNTIMPDSATHLLVFSSNKYGEHATPGSELLTDASLPKAKPLGVEFTDEDGDRGSVSGTIKVQMPEDADSQLKIDEVACYWGRSATRKHSNSPLITTLNIKEKMEYKTAPTPLSTSEGKITHIICFSKNQFGEYPSPVSVKIVDQIRPCQERSAADCPKSVSITKDADPERNKAKAVITFTGADNEDNIDHYELHWGKSYCSDDDKSDSEKISHIRDVQKGETKNGDKTYEVDLSAGTYAPSNPDGDSNVLEVQVFAANKQLGVSKKCVSASWEDDYPEEPEVPEGEPPLDTEGLPTAPPEKEL
eukprot:TRINITY_DN39792_c0_g1_i1.p1 TRINITY_DN39792_c0_g1~~TRINITY_DN39792_c0_g1_i1.p1  ORF type:complete len:676 (-),score=153.45 TRINITY_DN39792_c0_g1_i1:127-2154(-)